MNELPKHAEYIRAIRLIRFGYGVSGSVNVSKGCVGKIVNRNDYPQVDRMLVDLVGIGVRGMTIKDIEVIDEKEYFVGMLKG